MPIPEAVPTDPAFEPRSRGARRPKVQVIGMRARGVVSQPEDRHRVRESGTPFLLARDILSVENVDNVDWEFKYERRRYLIKVGETGLVPFPALVNALGDPRSVEGEQTKFKTDEGQAGLIPTRYESLSTLFARYAVENENITDLVEFAPKVVCRHMETGQIITFPVHDPECAPWPVESHVPLGHEPSGDRARVVALEDENRNMRQEMQELRELVNQRLPPPASPMAPMADQTEQTGVFDPASLLAGGAGLGGATPDRGPAATFE